MSNPSKAKGDRAELEVQALWRDHTGVPARRALGAGRKDDVGDIHGVPNTVVQVANRKDVAAAVRLKPLEAEIQRAHTGEWTHDLGNPDANGVYPVKWVTPPVPFACTFLRLRGGEYRVVMTPEQFFTLWREATA